MKGVCKGLGPIPVDERLVRDIYLDGTKLNTTTLLSSDGKRGSNRQKVTFLYIFFDLTLMSSGVWTVPCFLFCSIGNIPSKS